MGSASKHHILFASQTVELVVFRRVEPKRQLARHTRAHAIEVVATTIAREARHQAVIPRRESESVIELCPICLHEQEAGSKLEPLPSEIGAPDVKAPLFHVVA